MTERIDVVKIIVQNDEGLVLAVREAESEKWELPGGKIKSSEDRFKAAERELLDETGLESSNFEDVVRIEVENDICVNCYIVHTQGSDTVEIDKRELDEFRWVKPEEYKELDWHADSGYSIPAVEKLDKYLS